MFGHAQELSFDDRVKWVEENMEGVVDSAIDPLGSKGWWRKVGEMFAATSNKLRIQSVTTMLQSSNIYFLQVQLFQMSGMILASCKNLLFNTNSVLGCCCRCCFHLVAIIQSALSNFVLFWLWSRLVLTSLIHCFLFDFMINIKKVKIKCKFEMK